MNIIWNENPLLTQIILDEHEKKEFWYKIKIKELQDEVISSAYFHLDEDKQFFDLKQARQELNPEYFYPEWNDISKKGQKSALDQRVDELYECYIGDFEHNSHCGDCTCVPMSCSKCHAEHLLGINTTKGLGKHEGSAINGAFTKLGTKFPTRDSQNSINEAITHLDQYIPTAAWKGAEAHFERWINEKINATKWLKKYRDDHFSS